jgi:hypothetical protein
MKINLRLLLSIIGAIILTVLAYLIKRNKNNIFYLNFFYLSIMISILLSIIVAIPLHSGKGAIVLTIISLLFIFLIISNFLIFYKIENRIFFMKKDFFKPLKSIEIKEIKFIKASIELKSESPSFKIEMNDGNVIFIDRYIENINGFFMQLKEINKSIIVHEEKNFLKYTYFIFAILIQVIFYTIFLNILLKRHFNML